MYINIYCYDIYTYIYIYTWATLQHLSTDRGGAPEPPGRGHNNHRNTTTSTTTDNNNNNDNNNNATNNSHSDSDDDANGSERSEKQSERPLAEARNLPDEGLKVVGDRHRLNGYCIILYDMIV